MNAGKLKKINGEDFSAYFDNKGSIERIVFCDRHTKPAMGYTLYEINGHVADASEEPNDTILSFRLATKEAGGKLTILPGKEIAFHFESEEKEVAKNLSVVFPLPIETEFHIPESRNAGRRIDRDMPVGEQYNAKLYYNFLLVDVGGLWMRFMVRKSRLSSASTRIWRHPEILSMVFTWNVTDDALMAVFSSMYEAIRDYESWLEKDQGIRKLRDDPNIPNWVHNVKLVLTIDMMRSNWEIAHDYNDVTDLATELKKTGCPQDTLFYLPGWNGAYDSTYPTYQPHPELGGEEKFREMMETLHKNGFRVMVHTNAWGLDPYHPEIDKFLKYVRKDEEGNYLGWQCNVAWLKRTRRTLDFRTDRVPFHGDNGGKSFAFETVYIPDACEAFISVGNLKVGDASVKFTIGRRALSTPPGWFKDHEEYVFPFPFVLNAGKNKVQVEVVGEAKPDWDGSWYKVLYCFTAIKPYGPAWTHPILQADTNNPEWAKIFVDNVEAAVKKYKIDAVHVDATGFYFPSDSRRLLQTLKERLRGVAISGEFFGTVEEMGYWTFCQGAKQKLVDYVDVIRATCHQGDTAADIVHRSGAAASLPEMRGLENLYKWLNKDSRVTDFVKNYVYVYPHLCAAGLTCNAFVPVATVCNTLPPRPSPMGKEESWRILRDARRLNYIPGLRLNYRQYGLDEETAKAIKTIASM